MDNQLTFADLNLPEVILKSLTELNFTIPTPVQEQAIPILLSGSDLLARAQTGTGKTAAFALPLLSKINAQEKKTQVLILTPTRELALQVAEAVASYGKFMSKINIATLFGGADYRKQITDLNRKPQIVIATPGRLRDHIDRGTINLASIESFVLDEADEMLRMGFLEEVEWLLEQMPKSRQLAFFSATMPKQIQKIAQKHLQSAKEVNIAPKEEMLPAIKQHFCCLKEEEKCFALARFIEVEETDGVIVFVKTKQESNEVTANLKAVGINAIALNGDIPQKLREESISLLKKGKVDILVATDVAARGIDIERISHVINFHAPNNPETYIHRIGRTGRAGRSGKAILFLTRRELFLLNRLERANKQKILEIRLPTNKEIQEIQFNKLKEKIKQEAEKDSYQSELKFIEDCIQANGLEIKNIAAIICKLSGLLPKLGKEELKISNYQPREDKFTNGNRRGRSENNNRERDNQRKPKYNSMRMTKYRIEVGSKDGVQHKNILGAIANEAGLERSHIRDIEIGDKFSTLSLPKGISKELLQLIKKIWICGKQSNISELAVNN